MKTIKYAGIELPVIDSKNPMVPISADHVELDIQDKRALAYALISNKPALLVGETGTGKTSAVKELAYLTKRPYARVNMTGYTTPDELIGSKSVKDGATYYEDGPVSKAMKEGAILVLDEINATSADCMFILHGLLDQDKRITLPNGEVIQPHADFRVFATCNPDYEGTKSLNKALIDRFPIIIEVNTLSPAKEQALLVKRTGIGADVAENLVTIANMLRKDYAESKIGTFTSTRTLMNISDMVVSGMELKQAYTLALIHKTRQEDEQKLLDDVFCSVLKMAAKIDDNGKIVVITQGELNTYKENEEKMKSALLEQKQKLEDFNTVLSDIKDKMENIKSEKMRAEAEAQEHLKTIEALKADMEKMSETIKAYSWIDAKLKG